MRQPRVSRKATGLRACVCAYVCVQLLCLVFIIAARLDKEVTINKLSTLTLQLTVNAAIMSR